MTFGQDAMENYRHRARVRHHLLFENLTGLPEKCLFFIANKRRSTLHETHHLINLYIIKNMISAYIPCIIQNSIELTIVRGFDVLLPLYRMMRRP